MKIYIAEINDKNGSERVRKLLQYGFREVYGGEFPEIEKTDKGKPYFPAKPDVHFSLSHTDTHVMCAIGECPVGCDIQTVREVSDKLIQRVCTPKELKAFEFFQLWTLKESWIKLKGGLDREIKDVEFAGTPDDILPPAPSVRARLYEIGDCVAAVCTSGDSLPYDFIKVENI